MFLASLPPEQRANYLDEEPAAPLQAPAAIQDIPDGSSDLLELLRQLEQQERLVENRYDDLIDLQKERIDQYESFRANYDTFMRKCPIHGIILAPRPSDAQVPVPL